MHHTVQLQTMRALVRQHREGRDQPMLDKVVQLPVEIYTDPQVFAQEMRTVFKQEPLLVGHSAQLREPGSYLLSEWSKLPFLIVRADDMRLRGYLNVCRHRGAPLVSGKEACLKALVCPYHGWSYDLNGQLKGITKAYNFPELKREEFSLVELSVAERSGLIWLHPTPGASIDLDAHLGAVGDDLENFKLDELSHYRKTCAVKNANWKLLIKTYLEGYHVPYLHRNTLSRGFRNGVIVHESIGRHIRLAAARTNFSGVLGISTEIPHILDFASVYYSLFPHGFLIMHPDYVSINLFYPESPDQTIWTHEMLYRSEQFEGSDGQKALEKRFAYTNDVVFDGEDFAIAERVQKNLAHGGNTVHTLGLEEGLVALFQRNIEGAIESHR